jgi:hypothetical protein
MKNSFTVKKKRDDDLYGLLSTHKSYMTYIRVLMSEEQGTVILQMSDNPGKWLNLQDEKFRKYRVLRRLEIGVNQLSTRYISPFHLVKILGPLIGLKLSEEKTRVIDNLQENGLYMIEVPIKFKVKVLQGVRKIINLPSQKKYEILEKSLMEDQEQK